ncbi:MAG TPA: ABC transporter permease [Thermoanaerobaculia bacterium]|nr:ABC transporter permease [Thermoanaerobaculia bacterium]
MAVKDLPVTVIAPGSVIRLGELWEHRELLYFFVWRDVKVRYKQTALGAAWAVLQPLLTMLIFTVFFGRMAGIGSEGVPYPIFSYAGLLPWIFFSHGLGQASNSLVGSAGLLKKVYFPRLIVPVAAVLGGLVDFAVSFVVLIGMMFWYGVQPGWGVLLLPLLLLLSAASALGAGLFLSAVNVEFRDVRYVMPFFIQLLLFVTPVIYPASKVTAKLEEMGLPGWLYGLNPMAGVIQGFRWSLLGSGMNPGPLLAAGTAVTVLLLIGGLFYFRRMERTFADVV